MSSTIFNWMFTLKISKDFCTLNDCPGKTEKINLIVFHISPFRIWKSLAARFSCFNWPATLMPVRKKRKEKLSGSTPRTQHGFESSRLVYNANAAPTTAWPLGLNVPGIIYRVVIMQNMINNTSSFWLNYTRFTRVLGSRINCNLRDYYK